MTACSRVFCSRSSRSSTRIWARSATLSMVVFSITSKRLVLRAICVLCSRSVAKRSTRWESEKISRPTAKAHGPLTRSQSGSLSDMDLKDSIPGEDLPHCEDVYFRLANAASISDWFAPASGATAGAT